jgi:hypothetical protein
MTSDRMTTRSFEVEREGFTFSGRATITVTDVLSLTTATVVEPGEVEVSMPPKGTFKLPENAVEAMCNGLWTWANGDEGREWIADRIGDQLDRE